MESRLYLVETRLAWTVLLLRRWTGADRGGREKERRHADGDTPATPRSRRCSRSGSEEVRECRLRGRRTARTVVPGMRGVQRIMDHRHVGTFRVVSVPATRIVPAPARSGAPLATMNSARRGGCHAGPVGVPGPGALIGLVRHPIFWWAGRVGGPYVCAMSQGNEDAVSEQVFKFMWHSGFTQRVHTGAEVGAVRQGLHRSDFASPGAAHVAKSRQRPHSPRSGSRQSATLRATDDRSGERPPVRAPGS